MDEFSVSIPLLYSPLFSCVFYWCDQYFSYFLEHASCFCFLLVALKVCRPTHWYILTWVPLRVDILLVQNFQKWFMAKICIWIVLPTEVDQPKFKTFLQQNE